MVKATKNGVVVGEYTYDPTGMLFKKQSAAETKYYAYNLSGELIYEEQGDKKTSYIYAVGLIAKKEGTPDSEGKVYNLHKDHTGSVVSMTDEAGNKVWAGDYRPFGEKIDEEDTNIENYMFTGKQYFAELELYYFNARWYDSTLGRFTTEDPAADDPTLYVYGFNNPMKFVDPTGMAGINLFGGFSNLAAQHIPGASQILDAYNTFNLFITLRKNIEIASIVKELQGEYVSGYSKSESTVFTQDNKNYSDIVAKALIKIKEVAKKYNDKELKNIATELENGIAQGTVEIQFGDFTVKDQYIYSNGKKIPQPITAHKGDHSRENGKSLIRINSYQLKHLKSEMQILYVAID